MDIILEHLLQDYGRKTRNKRVRYKIPNCDVYHCRDYNGIDLAH